MEEMEQEENRAFLSIYIFQDRHDHGGGLI
jgi:hypothetical protein